MRNRTQHEKPGVVEARSAAPVEEDTSISASRHPLEQLIANTADAVIALDQHFHVCSLNPAASETIDWASEAAVGRECQEVLKCRNLNRMVLCGTSSCPLVKVLQQKRSLNNEELIIGAEPGRSCEVSASVTLIEVDDEPQVIFMARNMAAVKVASQVRANFVSMVSHELRTPLNSVHGFIDLLLQGHMGELNDEQHMYLSYAEEGVQQLISIVEDILFMTRSDSGQFDIKQQEVNVRVLVRQVINSLKPQAFKAGVEVLKDISSPSPILFADPQRIKQVLNNLLTNAIKFTPPGGTVTIRARQQANECVLVSVSDTGCGIPQEDRTHVFERFYQSNNGQQSKVGGYGLGLTIAKLIVEQHDGNISFESDLDKGTTFFFTVPLYRKQDKT